MNTVKSAVSFWGDAGCNWLRIKSIVFNVIVFPLLVYVLYIIFGLHATRSSYTEITGTITEVNGTLVNVKYTYNNKDMTATIVNTTQNIKVNSPITLYVDTTNPERVSAQQPLTKNIKITIIVMLIVFMISMIIETVLVFTSKSVCNILGGAELAGDAIGTTFDALK
jgi:hypothetical protein